MKYVSTRGASAPVSFFEALLSGLAPDGGLFVPEAWPRLRPYLAENRGALGYRGAAAEVLSQFAAGDLSFAGAAELAGEAYPGRFAHPAVAPLKQLGAGLWLLELFHSPSLAFKDVAMQLIAPLYERALFAAGRRLTVICATSGDTGGAAVEALKGADAVDLFVLLPKGRVSDVQRRFMTASGAGNVFALEVDGDFDLCQSLVKALFADAAFSSEVGLSGVNSINWARIVAQAVYYVEAAHALGRGGDVHFCVPSGNFGDAFAGFVAKRMGAPIGKILVATNANDSLAKSFQTGRVARAQVSAATLSPAMDIQVASNFERLAFEALGRDGAETARLYRQLPTGGFDLPGAARATMDETFEAVSVSDEETRAAMRETYVATGEVVCPHTAVGLAGLSKARAEGRFAVAGPVVSLATAHPAKFAETVEDTLAIDPALPEHCADLFYRAERIDPIADDLSALKIYIRERTRAAR
jgi:threonine synthase